MLHRVLGESILIRGDIQKKKTVVVLGCEHHNMDGSYFEALIENAQHW